MIVTLALPLWGVGGSHIHAQGQDPTLAAMILLYTDKAKKELKQQEEMMLLETTFMASSCMQPKFMAFITR